MAFNFDKEIDYSTLPVNKATVDKVGERSDEFMELWRSQFNNLRFGPMLVEWLRQHPEDLTA